MTRPIHQLASIPAPRPGAWHKRAHLSASVAVAASPARFRRTSPQFSLEHSTSLILGIAGAAICVNEFLFLGSLPTRTRTPRILESPSRSLSLEREGERPREAGCRRDWRDERGGAKGRCRRRRRHGARPGAGGGGGVPDLLQLLRHAAPRRRSRRRRGRGGEGPGGGDAGVDARGAAAPVPRGAHGH